MMTDCGYNHALSIVKFCSLLKIVASHFNMYVTAA